MMRAARWVAAAWLLVLAVPAAAEDRVADSGQCVFSSAPTPDAAPAVLLAPAQGSASLRPLYAESLCAALHDALASFGFRAARGSVDEARAMIECQTPECIEAALAAAGASFAIVPAIWLREQGAPELTLTLLQPVGRNVNASTPVEGQVADAAAMLVDLLMSRRAAVPQHSDALAGGPRFDGLTRNAGPSGVDRVAAHPHAWKAGPIVMIAAGLGAFGAIGIAAGVRSDDQKLNPAAVGAWSAIGAVALASGAAWWVVGKRRRLDRATSQRDDPAISLQPTRIDFRLRF